MRFHFCSVVEQIEYTYLHRHPSSLPLQLGEISSTEVRRLHRSGSAQARVTSLSRKFASCPPASHCSFSSLSNSELDYRADAGLELIVSPHPAPNLRSASPPRSSLFTSKADPIALQCLPPTLHPLFRPPPTLLHSHLSQPHFNPSTFPQRQRANSRRIKQRLSDSGEVALVSWRLPRVLLSGGLHLFGRRSPAPSSRRLRSFVTSKLIVPLCRHLLLF